MHGSSHHLLQKKFALVRYNAPHVQILLLLSAFRNNVIVTCNNLICDMCSPTWETHISNDMCSPTWETHIPSDMCFPTWETQILLLVSTFRNNVIVTCNNLICNMCSPTWETHIPSSSKVECYTPQQKVESKIFFPALDTTTPKSNYEYI